MTLPDSSLLYPYRIEKKDSTFLIYNKETVFLERKRSKYNFVYISKDKFEIPVTLTFPEHPEETKKVLSSLEKKLKDIEKENASYKELYFNIFFAKKFLKEKDTQKLYSLNEYDPCLILYLHENKDLVFLNFNEVSQEAPKTHSVKEKNKNFEENFYRIIYPYLKNYKKIYIKTVTNEERDQILRDNENRKIKNPLLQKIMEPFIKNLGLPVKKEDFPTLKPSCGDDILQALANIYNTEIWPNVEKYNFISLSEKTENDLNQKIKNLSISPGEICFYEWNKTKKIYKPIIKYNREVFTPNQEKTAHKTINDKKLLKQHDLL